MRHKQPTSKKQKDRIVKMGRRLMELHLQEILHWIDAGWTVNARGELQPPCARMFTEVRVVVKDEASPLPAGFFDGDYARRAGLYAG